MRPSTYIVFILAIAPFVMGVLFYPALPTQIASHWNAAGDANGYTSKFWGVFLLPIMIAILSLVYLAIPAIDPLKNNIALFRSYYDKFWIVLFLFLIYIHALSIYWNLGHIFNFTVALGPALSALFYVIGMLMEHAKRNWFFGIRTPWTLSSDVVWEKTHILGAKLFKIAAILSLGALIFKGTIAFLFLIIPIVTSALIAVVYSYFIYQNLK